jgi:hypothetical protein
VSPVLLDKENIMGRGQMPRETNQRIRQRRHKARMKKIAEAKRKERAARK